MKRLKLSTGPSTNFTFIGISCHLKDYKLTLNLNQALNFAFRKVEDFVYHNDPGKTYAFYLYHHHDERRNYILLSNHSPEGKLLPKLKTTDFFLIADEPLAPATLNALIPKIRAAKQVLTAFPVDQDNHKELAAIIEDLELHLLENKGE
jgi:hypothetical protein